MSGDDVESYYDDGMATIYHGDCREVLRALPEGSVQCCVTSPPYWGLRDYGVDGQIGLESTPEEFVAEMVEVFREVWRVLRDDGTLWLNLGDSYAGSWGAQSRGNTTGEGKSTLEGSSMLSARQIAAHPQMENGTGSMKRTPGLKPKDLIGIPWRVVLALQADGWYLRQDIIWHKPNPMPESVTDRCTKSHEYIFLLSKSERYYFDAASIREPATDTSLARWAQDIDKQRGSDRVPGKTNGAMKAVGGPRRSDKQRGHARRHTGFDDRWDMMSKEKQMSTGRNKRDVWTVATAPFPGAHFATFPPDLIKPCILAGAPSGGVVLDPFTGAGTTMMVAKELGRKGIGIELNEEYIKLSLQRIQQETLSFK